MADWPEPNPKLLNETLVSLRQSDKLLPVGYMQVRRLCLYGSTSPVNGETVKLDWCWVRSNTRGTSVEAYKRYIMGLNGVSPVQSQSGSDQSQE